VKFYISTLVGVIIKASITNLPVYGSTQISKKHGSEMKFLASRYSLHITCCLNTRVKERGQLMFHEAEFICKVLELV